MTREEYIAHVRNIAQHILCSLDAPSAKAEGEEYQDWYDRCEYDGSVSTQMDALIGVDSDWKKSIAILNATDQDPDHVDPGMYEGRSWKETLNALAYHCFEMSIHEAMQCAWDEGDFDMSVLHYPTTGVQLGFFPDMVRFKVYSPDDAPFEERAYGRAGRTVYGKGPALEAAEIRNGISLVQKGWRSSENNIGITFEGHVEKPGVVLCRRVYTHLDSKLRDINQALEYLKANYGVKQIVNRKKKNNKEV